MALGNSFGNGFFINKPSGDLDVNRFIDSANINDNTQESALSTLVSSLKSSGLWEKLDVIYPFVGGTSASHSYNLKNIDQFQITWNGNVTHNSNGVTGDGSSGYGDTNFSLTSPQEDAHFSVYIRNDVLTSTNKQPFGAYKPGVNDSLIGIRLINSPSTTTTFISGTPFSFVETSSDNFYNISRSNNNLFTYKNNSSVGTISITDRDDNLLNVYILGSNFNGTSLLEPGDFNIAFFTAGKSLTLSDNQELYTIIQAFQTSLSRQV